MFATGNQDAEYRERRKSIVEGGMSYRTGQSIPRVAYNDNETRTWGIVYNKIKEMTNKYAVKQVRSCLLWCNAGGDAVATKVCVFEGVRAWFCRLQYLYTMKAMEENCGYSETNIPQLQDISDFLYSCTGMHARCLPGM